MQNKIVNCNGFEISNNKKICLIAGPCQLETEQHAMDMVGKIKEITSKLGALSPEHAGPLFLLLHFRSTFMFAFV